MPGCKEQKRLPTILAHLLGNIPNCASKIPNTTYYPLIISSASKDAVLGRFTLSIETVMLWTDRKQIFCPRSWKKSCSVVSVTP